MTEDVRRPPGERQRPSIGLPPPPEDLVAFPVWHVHAGTVLCRVTTSGFGPWWFSSDAHGRFELTNVSPGLSRLWFLPEPDGSTESRLPVATPPFWI